MKFADWRLVSSRYCVCYGDVVAGPGVHAVNIETWAAIFEGVEIYAERAAEDLPVIVTTFSRKEVASSYLFGEVSNVMLHLI